MELRKDYILDRWVIIATDRKKRPKQFEKDHNQNDDSICYFCPGSEHLTPPEIGRFPQTESWKLRWFPNKFPVVHMYASTADQFCQVGPRPAETNQF